MQNLFFFFYDVMAFMIYFYFVWKYLYKKRCANNLALNLSRLSKFSFDVQYEIWFINMTVAND